MLAVSAMALIQIGIWGILDLAAIGFSHGIPPDPSATVSPETTRTIYALMGVVLLNLVGLIWFLAHWRGFGGWLMLTGFVGDLAGCLWYLYLSSSSGGSWVVFPLALFSAAIGAMLVLFLKFERG